MTAHDQIRAMLDELMGTSRDGEKDRYRVKFDDPRVCKSFLLGCCPHDILASTRMDLGECSRVHDLALRADYEQAAKNKDYFYDIDAMEHLLSFIGECDRKTELAKRRLKETQEELSEEANQKAEMIHQLGEQMGTKLAKAELAGAQGLVEESLKLMKEVEDLKLKKSTAETEFRNSMPASSYQQQKLRVCEVCGAYLGIHDNDRRLADHFGGKLHLGFITIREKLEDLKQLVADRKSQRDKEREEMRKERDERLAAREKEEEVHREAHRSSKTRTRSRSKERHRRSRSRSRKRSRSRSRDRRSKKRSRRSRSRSRRSRSRSRRRRSRSRSHSQRSRSRRSRSHSRSKRSRSRSRTRRSRSRDRSSRKSKRRSRSRSRSHSRPRQNKEIKPLKTNSDSSDAEPDANRFVQEEEEKPTVPIDGSNGEIN